MKLRRKVDRNRPAIPVHEFGIPTNFRLWGEDKPHQGRPKQGVKPHDMSGYPRKRCLRESEGEGENDMLHVPNTPVNSGTPITLPRDLTAKGTSTAVIPFCAERLL